MNLIEKKYLIILALEGLWQEKFTKVFEIRIEPLRAYLSYEEIEELFDYLEKKDQVIEILKRPHFESAQKVVRDNFTYNILFKVKFENFALLLHENPDYKKIATAVLNSKETKTPLPRAYRWVDSQTYAADCLISFVGNKTKARKLFSILVNANGSFVSSASLIAETDLRTADNLRSTIMYLKRRLVKSGLTITPRKKHGEKSAYKIIHLKY